MPADDDTTISSSRMNTRKRHQIVSPELNSVKSPLRLKGSGELPSVALSTLAAFELRLQNIEKMLSDQGFLLREFTNSATFESTNSRDTEEKIKEVHKDFLLEKRQKLQAEKCRKIKSKFSLKWKKSLNTRKQAFYNHLRNAEKAALYSSWYSDSPNFLPLHLRPKVRKNERQDIVDTKVSEAKVAFNNKITTMNTSADNQRAKYISIDDEMMNLIKDKTSGDDESCSLLISWWEQDCKSAESLSHEIWEQKKQYLISMKNKSEDDGENTLVKIEDTSTQNEQQPARPQKNQNQTRHTRGKFQSPRRNAATPRNRQNQQQNSTPRPQNGARSNSPQLTRSNNNSADYNPHQDWRRPETPQNGNSPAPSPIPPTYQTPIPPPQVMQHTNPFSSFATQANPFLMHIVQQLCNPPGLTWNRSFHL